MEVCHDDLSVVIIYIQFIILGCLYLKAYHTVVAVMVTVVAVVVVTVQ